MEEASGSGGTVYTASLNLAAKACGFDSRLPDKMSSKPIKWNLDVLPEIVKTSTSIAEVLRKLGLRPVGGNYTTIKRHVSSMGLDTGHFLGQAHSRGRKLGPKPKVPLEEVLVAGRFCNTYHLKERLLKRGLLIYVCVGCGISEWRGQRLSLHLDHVNGDRADNRLCNLRLLCPNCHSQTKTYCGKSR